MNWWYMLEHHKRNAFWVYFSWFILCGVLFLAGEMLRTAETVQFYRIPWLDVAANYGVLGLLMCMAAAIGAMIMVGCAAVLRRVHPQGSVYLAGLVFALFVAVWLNLVRLLLGTFGLKLPFPASLQLLLFALLGLALFALMAKRILNWMGELTKSLRILPWIAIVTAVILTGYLLVEPRIGDSAPDVALKNPGGPLPNIVIIVLDGLTSHDMSLYGYPITTTPNLERLAQTWTVYNRANSTATRTLGVMPTLMTGRYPYTDDWYSYGDLTRSGGTWLSLASVLKSLGYETARLGGGFGYPPNLFHLHNGFNRWVDNEASVLGVNLLHGTLFSRMLTIYPLLTEYRLPALPFLARTSSSATQKLDWQEPIYDLAEQYFKEKASAVGDGPFFAYLHMERPNGTYWGNEYGGTLLPIEAGLTTHESQHPYHLAPYRAEQQPEIDHLRLRYDENILKADQQVGKLIDKLKSLGLYDQTMIVITADHGTNFIAGQQGYTTPLLAAAEHSVPLLVKYPFQTEGRTSSELISTVDIMPTVLDVVGVSLGSGEVDGISLLSPPQPGRSIFVRRIYDPTTHAVLADNWKLVRRSDQYLLFDLLNDPNERTPLALDLEPSLHDALEQFFDQDLALVSTSFNESTP